MGLTRDHHFTGFVVASDVSYGSPVSGVPHVIIPENLGIPYITTIKLRTVPPINHPHRPVISLRKICRPTRLDVINKKKFPILDRPAVGFGTEPTIDNAERLSQLKPNSKVHNGKVLRGGDSSKSRALTQWRRTSPVPAPRRTRPFPLARAALKSR